MAEYEMVNHPNHYNMYDVEVIDMMAKIWGNDAVALWCKLTAFKYRMRMGTKPNEPFERDLEKEKFYINAYKKYREKISQGSDTYVKGDAFCGSTTFTGAPNSNLLID